MFVIISSLRQNKKFKKEKITIGSSINNDFCIPEYDFELELKISPNKNSYVLTNNTNSVPLFKGSKFDTIDVKNIVRLLFPDSDEFINIQVVFDCDNQSDDLKTFNKMENLYEEIEYRRVSIIKEISHKINDLKMKISNNRKGAIFTHFAMLLSSLVCSFAVANYIMGLSIMESENYIHLPTNLKIWILYTILIFGIMLLFKQGWYGYFHDKLSDEEPKMPIGIQTLFISSSTVILLGVYAINLIYYLNYTVNLFFSVLISLFFISFAFCLSIASGYFKAKASVLSLQMNRFEYREDFEKVMRDYQQWINYFINTLSESKKTYIKDKMFKLRIKEFFEILIGVMTAPFLAYGVSNTLALCFPNAAGWIKLSGGIKFSPIFLVLASCLILFAFFLLSFAFSTMNKIKNSEVIKHDGFSQYLKHCADILGLAATIKTKKDIEMAFCIATVIILIEIIMNSSYFISEIGQDLSGMFLGITSALVPTSLLIAETFMLGITKFEIYAIDEILSKADK